MKKTPRPTQRWGSRWGSRFPVLNLRNVNVACRCRLFMPMSHVDFEKWSCPLSLSFLTSCRMSLGSMSPVEFKKCPIRRVVMRSTPFSSVPELGLCTLQVAALCKGSNEPSQTDNRMAGRGQKDKIADHC